MNTLYSALGDCHHLDTSCSLVHASNKKGNDRLGAVRLSTTETIRGWSICPLRRDMGLGFGKAAVLERSNSTPHYL